ncbi:Amino acid transporter [Coniochaeta hoffmannii]|uniref:Amino acid transporter n=1 Tax=Coniochaeta hoffmannii TaxID=91930 RepID=A0AA38RE92_9PEZI|nr:Amino acid transporter [Coniochaeta hoffmannii]
MNRQRKTQAPKHGGGQASGLSSNINLLNTIVGAGTLAMPAALSHFGIVLGSILIVWCGVTSAFGLYLQARSARYLDRGGSSFFALSQITYPNAAVVFDAAIAIKCFGVGVSYMIIIGQLMPGVVRGFDSRADDIPFLVDRQFWITAFMLVIIPLSFLRRLDSLKYTSVVALVSIGYLIVLVVYHFAADSHPDRGELRIITWGGPIGALKNLPVVIFAYTCHQNMFSILNEIKDNTPASIVGVIAASIGSAASIYVLVAITGYLTFGNSVNGNIISMYPPSVASTIGKAAIVILVMFSIPLQVHPCRASIDAVLKWRPNKYSRLPTSAPGRSSSPNGQPLMSSSANAPLDNHGSPASHISELRFAIITTVILVLSYATALTVSSLDRVLAYVGSTGSTSISFILPGLFYYKISDPEGVHHQRLTKEDDDAADVDESSSDEDALEPAGASLVDSVASLQSGVSGLLGRPRWRWMRRWRWDLEHLETGLLRKLALCLSIYGIIVMIVCLTMNLFVNAAQVHEVETVVL